MADFHVEGRTAADIEEEIAMLIERIEILKVERTAALRDAGISAKGRKEISIHERTPKQHRNKKSTMLSTIRRKGVDSLSVGVRRNIVLYSYNTYNDGETFVAFRKRLVDAMEREWRHHKTEENFLLAIVDILPPQDIEALRSPPLPAPIPAPAAASDVENPPAGEV